MDNFELLEVIERIKSNLTPDLLHKNYKHPGHRLAGHCYIASEALYHLTNKEYKPMVIKHEKSTHWFLQHRRTGVVIDITADQFKTKVPYSKGKGTGFLTKEPCKRTQELLRRIDASEVF